MATTQLDRVVRALKEIDDPRIVYVGRRTDKRQIRVQMDVKLPLARKVLELIKSEHENGNVVDGQDGEPDNDGE